MPDYWHFPDDEIRRKINVLRRRLTDELEIAYGEHQDDGPRRAAALSAAVRRFKRDGVIEITGRIADVHGIDLTTRTARVIIKILLGRGVSNAAVAKALARPDRGPGDHSDEYDRPEYAREIAEELSVAVQEHLADIVWAARADAAMSSQTIRRPFPKK